MHAGFGMGMGFGWMWIWPIVIIIVALVVIRAFMASPRQDRPGTSPEEILKERFARGEIDKEEYTTRLAELRK